METPEQVMTRFERGEIDRAELHALMALHARELIREMEEDQLNPAAALLERMLAGRLARRLTKRHGHKLVRECLIALAAVDNFPPAARLWNASHPDVPLHCFLRMKRPPVFRLIAIHATSPKHLRCETEHEIEGAPTAQPIRTTWHMERDERWQLRVVRK